MSPLARRARSVVAVSPPERGAMIEHLESRYLMASITWANLAGQTNFNAGSAWVGGVAPGAGDIAVFNSAGTVVQPTLTANGSVAGVQIDNSGADYNLSGSSFTLTVGANGVSVTSPTSTTANTSTVSAKLALGANATFTTTNNTGVTTLTVSGTLDTAGFRAATAGSGDVFWSGIVSGTGGVDAGSTGTTRLSGVNTFSGGVDINAGTLLVQTSTSALGIGSVNLGATSGSASATLATTVGFTNAITVRSGSTGAATLEGRNTSGTATLSGGLTLQKGVTIQKGSSSGAGNTTYSGAISGTGNITLKNQATGGLLDLSNASVNPTGTLTNNGTGAGGVRISGVIGSAVTGLIQDSTTSALDLRNNNPSFTGGVTINAGTLGATPTATGYTTQLGTGAIQLGATSGSNSATLSLNNATTAADISNAVTVRSGSSGEKVIRYSSTSGTGFFRGLVTLQTNLTFRKQGTGGGAFSIRGGTAGTGTVTTDHQGTSTFQFITGALNHTGSIINVGTGTAGVQISGGIGNNVTGITQNSNTSNVTVNTTAIARGSNFSVTSNGSSGVTIAAGLSASSAGTKTITHTGTGTGQLRITGVISNGSGAIALVQNSATSPLAITATNTFTGGVTVQEGVLIATGTSPGITSVESGGTLSVNNGSTGTFNTGSLSMATGSTFLGQINTNVAGTGYDTVNVTGTLNVGYATLNLSGTRTTTAGQTITLIANDSTDAVTGWFYGLPEGGVVASNGVAYTISYRGGTGNDVVLTDIGVVSALTDFSPYSVAPAHSSINAITNSPNTGDTRFDTWGPLTAAQDIRWVRTFVNGVATATPGTYTWTKWDHNLDTADENGIRISGGFSGAPSWVTTTGGFPVGASQLALWQQYVTDVVTHTAGRVKYWEVWNEPPNFTNGLGTPADYGALVAATYDAIKAVDPEAQVGIAAVSTYTTWIKNAILNGAAGKYDYLTLHPYEIGDTIHQGHEPGFMSIASTVRKMLADVDPAKVNVPIWWTEIGQPITSTHNAVSQANQLVKFFTMGLAQGVQRISWFEPLDGDSGAFGLFTNSYVIRESGQAYARLIDHLGTKPNYLGWVQLDGPNYGFVFEGVQDTVMIAWSPVGTTDTVNFGGTVTVINPITGATTTGTSYALTNEPVIVTGVPSALITAAKANVLTPFPWDGDYTGASSVNVSYVNGITETGLHHLNDNTVTILPAYGQNVAYAGGGLFAQAETLVLNGASAASTNLNYSGTGYVDYTALTGGYMQWTTTSTSATTKTFRIRYANGDATARTVALSVNGGTATNVSFAPTGGWNNWWIQDVTVNVVSGTNNIRLTTTGTDGPNIDAVLNWSAAQNYTLDPNFLSYDHGPITITAEVRRTESNAGAGFNLTYESTTGFKNIGWNNVTTNASWQTMTFNISDAEIVNRWGKGFWFNSDTLTNSRYYIRNVTVTKNGWTLMAMEGDNELPATKSSKKASAAKFGNTLITETSNWKLEDEKKEAAGLLESR